MNAGKRNLVLGAAALLSVSFGYGQAQSSTAPATQPGPKISPSPSVQQKAQNPAPGPQAQGKSASNVVGKGKAKLANSNRPSSDYVNWTEEIDIGANGQPEVTDIALDNRHKVLYFAKDQTFTCMNGSKGDGQVLMAVYAQGNTLGKPVGSGWVVAELDQDECAVPAAGLYGCKFDASGSPTGCGVAVVKEEDVTITPVPRRKVGGE